LERRPADEHLVQDAAQGPDVDADAGFLVAEDLG
jgi:hypothetical protein